MAIFQWSEAYNGGIAVVDEQHRRLVDMVNEMDEAFADGKELEVIRGLYQKLAEYTVYHFQTEERLMQEGSCPSSHFQRHQKEHQEFVDTVVRLGGTLEKVDRHVADALLDFLIKWLLHHTQGEDKEMARLLLGREALLDKPGTEHETFLQRALDQEVAQSHLLGALRESEARFRTLADEIPVLVWLGEVDGRRTFFNKPWLDFAGRTLADERGIGWMSGVHAEDVERLSGVMSDALTTRKEYTVEFRLRNGSGHYRWLLETGVPRFVQSGGFNGFVGACVDITERKRTEHVLELARDQLERRVEERTRELQQSNDALKELNAKLVSAQGQLLQSEKMASIGQLAAGVAHEINNPIGFVNSNLGALQRYVEDLLKLADAVEAGKGAQELADIRQAIDLTFLREDVMALLGESRDGIERVKRIVQDLKDFSHVDESEWQWADLNKGLESTLNVAANEIKYKADVVRDYGQIPEVHCLPQQLNQVFMNLLVNAAQAMDGRGTITVRTRQDGDGVRVEISDTGHGIPPESLKRIFDPFFTTKPIGKGTGLGLSVAYGIVERHKGRIEVESEEGRGTMFRIWLPTNAESND